MKATRIFILIIVSLQGLISNAQVTRDSVPHLHRIRIGIDLIKPLFSLNERNYDDYIYKVRNYEASIGYRINRFIEVPVEIGYLSAIEDDVRYYSYKTKGFYVKPGINFNVLYSRKRSTPRVELIVGYRLGITRYNEKSQWLFNEDFWSSKHVYNNERNTNAFWHEGVLGFRRNFFTTSKTALGFGVAVKIRSKIQPDSYSRGIIPGFGSDRSLSGGLNFDVGLMF